MSGNRVGPSLPPGPGKVFYPMFVDIEGRRALVVGGGPVATEKVEKLLDHGAAVRLVSPDLTPELREMVRDGRIHELHERTYEPSDLDGCFMVIAATNLDAVNRMIWQDAEALNILCNVVDVPPMCNFIVPSIVRRGELAIAISTGGASPVVAKHIRRDLEATYGPEWEALVDLLREVRDELKVRYLDMPSRRVAVERLMETDVVQRLAAGDEDGARELARAVLDIEREVRA
ncbi:MAG: bifunctional precorrin-2 dehydrogenase/sirohydrochlorin ferrochelatase [Thermoleophilia bacterium]